MLEIITKLTISVSVRDALLRREPTLLFDTVSQAVSGSWKHNAASIAMLSHPLPQHITLPAASQNLFLGIVDHATQQPSTASIKPIYQLLKGGLAPLLGLLSHDTLAQLEDHFVAVLRNTIGQEDQCLTMYCLAIMKAIVTAADEDPSFSTPTSYETQELLASTPNTPRWKPKTMKQYFSGSKASKTLHLVVLRVLWASGATSEDTVEETVECLGLANGLIMFVPESTRETWCTENPIIVRKLQEKSSQSGLDTRVQLPAFAFICSLCRARDIPETMVDQLAVILSKATNLTEKLSLGQEPSMRWFASVLNGVQLAEVIISITSFAVQGSPSEIFKLASIVVPIVECLSRISKSNESVIDGALAALGSAAVAQDLTKLPQTFSSESAGALPKDGVCGAAVLSGRKAIGHAICSLFLGAALAADHSQTDVASELYPLLVETHALSVPTGPSCKHVSDRPQAQQLKSRDVPAETEHIESDWQHALGAHLQAKAHEDQSVLATFFSKACADLEKRCTEVEAPLREEREKRAELQHQYDSLYRAYTSLEDHKSRAEMRTDALEAEKAEHTHDLEQTKVENDELLAKVENLEARLRQNQQQAQQELEKLKQEFANAEMDHATASASSEERLEELEIKLSNVQADRNTEKAANDQLRADIAEICSSKDALEADVQNWRTIDEKHKRAMSSVERAREELASKCAGLVADLGVVRQMAASDKVFNQEQVLRLEREAHEQIETLQVQHGNDLEHVQQGHREQLSDLSTKLASAQAESKHIQTDLEAQLEKREKKLSDYHKKIGHLKEVCTDKDDQIAEANAMRSNLMAAMGLGKMNPQGSQSPKRRSTRSGGNQSELFDDTESSVPFIDILGAAAKASATQQNATQDSQMAPSPKRARPRKSGASMPPPAQSRVSTNSRAMRSSTQGRSTVKRQPLQAISGNVSPSKHGSKTPFSSGKGFEGGFEDTTFDGSEVFASTPGAKGRDMEVLPDDETEIS